MDATVFFTYKSRSKSVFFAVIPQTAPRSAANRNCKKPPPEVHGYHLAGTMDMARTIRAAVLKEQIVYGQAGADTVAASVPASKAEAPLTKAAAASRAATFRRLKNSTTSRLKYPIT